MKVIIAPDSFKESLGASAVAEAIARGVRRAIPGVETVKLPVADGGEGTVDALLAATGGRKVPVPVTGPLGEPVAGFIGLLGDRRTAVIEVAAACGLQWVAPESRNPLLATSFGVGELIRAALDHQVSHIIIGLGGSATNDAGIGMLQALGARCRNAQGEEIARGGGALNALAAIDTRGLDPRLRNVALQVACDVTNPLLGPRGATAVFAPQKGATPAMLAQLEANLQHVAAVISAQTGQRIADYPGAGAAGGLGAALIALLGAHMRPGIEVILDALDFDNQLQGADLVITGEGRIDAQTANGKAPAGIMRRAAAQGCPCVVLAGSLGAGYEQLYTLGLTAAFSLVPGVIAYEQALREASNLLESAAYNLAALWLLGAKRQTLPVGG